MLLNRFRRAVLVKIPSLVVVKIEKHPLLVHLEKVVVALHLNSGAAKMVRISQNFLPNFSV